MSEQSGAGGARSGLFANLKGLLAAVLASGRTRLDLLVTELEEEKLRLIDILVSAVAAMFLLGLGIVLAVLFLTVLFWEQRLVVLGIAAGGVLLSGMLFALRLHARVARPSALFRASLREIDKDIEALRGRS